MPHPRPDPGRPLFVVPCSATKNPALRSRPLPAAEAYHGQAFRRAAHILRTGRAQWCILSAKYGWLWPSTRIEWYDHRLQPADVTPDAIARWEAWEHLTNRQHARLRMAGEVIVLGGRLYAEAARLLLQRPVRTPFSGLPIGRILQRLSQAQTPTDLLNHPSQLPTPNSQLPSCPTPAPPSTPPPSTDCSTPPPPCGAS